MAAIKNDVIKRNKASANALTHLGAPDAEVIEVKAELVRLVQKLVEDQGVTQSVVAARIGVSQPDVSRMLKGQVANISVERLMTLLQRLGCEVEIKVKPSGGRAFASIHLG